MLSGRLNWRIEPSPFSRAVSALRAEAQPSLDLTSANPTAVELAYPSREIAAALNRVPDFRYEPHPQGLFSAREVIASRYAGKGKPVSPSQLLITSSTSEAYSFLFKLLCNAGDEVLVPCPSYPLFEYLAALDTARVQPYWLSFDGGWFIDFDDLERRITPRTKAIVIVSPNNPTGNCLTAEDAERLSQIALRAQLPVICDEVFVDYPLHPSNARLSTPRFDPQVLTFLLNGLSKSAGMPQMKLGWILVEGPARECAEAMQGLEWIADTYLSVSTPVQAALAGLICIGDRIRAQVHERLLANHAAVHHLLAASPVQMLPVEGGWSAILQLPQTRSEEEWCLGLLRTHRVITQPGYLFDMPREPFLVVSLLTPPARLIDGINALLQIADG